MDNDTKSRVYNALKDVDELGPLRFVKDKEDPKVALLNYKKYCKTHSLQESVYRTLELVREFHSFRKEGDELIFETGPFRYRSAIDIWRHLLFALPDLKITDVMQNLYALAYAERITTNVCSVIHRRTFRLGVDQQDDITDNHIYNSDDRDEFGLYFDDWR